MKNLYDRTIAGTVPVVNEIAESQLDLPTPCTEFDVRALLNHLFVVVEQFRRAARGEQMDFSDTRDRVTGDWKQRFAHDVDALAAAWSAPKATEGQTASGFPRALAARLPVIDLTVHGWDLARATGRPFACDQARADEIHGLLVQMAPMREGSDQFAAAIEIGDEASPFDKVLALSGRDPLWKP